MILRGVFAAAFHATALPCRFPAARISHPFNAMLGSRAMSLASDHDIRRAQEDAIKIMEPELKKIARPRKGALAEASVKAVTESLKLPCLVVIEHWGKLQRDGVPPTAFIMSCVLSAYSALRCDNLVVALYQDFIRHPAGTPQALHLTREGLEAVLTSAARMNKPREGWEVFQELGKTRTIPEKFREMLLAVSAISNEMTVVDAIQKHFEAVNYSPTNRVYIALMSHAVKVNDLSKAAAIFHDVITREGATMDKIQRSKALALASAILQKSVDRHDPDTVFSILHDLETLDEIGNMLSKETLMRCLNVASTCGHSELATRCVQFMEVLKAPHLDKAYNRAFRSYLVGIGDIKAAGSLLQTMVEKGIALEPESAEALTTAIVCKWRRYKETRDQEMNLEEYLPAQGQVPLEVLNGVMAAYGRHGYFSFARRILETMPHTYKLQPNADSYASVMEACVHPKRIRLTECLDLAEDMSRVKMKLTPRCFSALTLALLRSNDVDGAIEMIKRAERSDAPVAVSVYEGLVRKLARRNDIDDANDLIAHMRGRRLFVPPEIRKYVESMAASGGFDFLSSEAAERALRDDTVVAQEVDGDVPGEADPVPAVTEVEISSVGK